MKAKRTAEEYRAICIVLVIALLIVGYWWYRSENVHTKKVEELKAEIAALEDTIHSMKMEENEK